LNKQTLRALNSPLALVNQAQVAIKKESKNALDQLLEHAYDYADSAEQREGITAFLEKRTPRF